MALLTPRLTAAIVGKDGLGRVETSSPRHVRKFVMEGVGVQRLRTALRVFLTR
jgi:hypothetical protein